MATPSDAKELLSIYAPYVKKTAITFEYQVPSEEEFKRRISHTLERYPYLTASKDGVIIGYAYVSPFRERAAYGWAVETSVYVAENSCGTGCGTQLYEVLEHILKMQHIINAYACITFPNPGSIAFHQNFGYKTIGHFTNCGYKLNSWWDMIWMEKMLGEHSNPPLPVIPVGELNLPQDLTLLCNS